MYPTSDIWIIGHSLGKYLLSTLVMCSLTWERRWCGGFPSWNHVWYPCCYLRITRGATSCKAAASAIAGV